MVGALHRNHRRGYSAGKGFGHAVVRGDRQLALRRRPRRRTSPTRSCLSPSKSLSMAYLVRSRRLGWKSSASIEFETSTTSIISIPRLSTSRSFEPSCGRASARVSRANAVRYRMNFRRPAPRRSVGHERTDGFEPAETAEAPACELSGGRPYGDEQREEPQQPEVFGICESEHYGRDFNQRVRNRNSTSSRARAAAAQRRYSSV